MLNQLKAEKSRIADHMHAIPETVETEEILGRALAVMQDKNIRHLPVLRQGELAGILSDREANLVRFIPDGLNLKVSDVMTSPVFAVNVDETLSAVVEVMASKKYGAVVVQNDLGDVVGIFTVTDAMRILNELLQS